MAATVTNLFKVSPLMAYAPSAHPKVAYGNFPFTPKPTVSVVPQVDQPLAASVERKKKEEATLYQFTIAPLVAVASALWDLIKAIIRKIIEVLGLKGTIEETKNADGVVEGLKVQAEGNQTQAEQAVSSINAVVNSDSIKQVAKSSLEPFATIEKYRADYADQAKKISDFEKSWQEAHPDLPLPAARQSNVSPEIDDYLTTLESIKALITVASTLYGKYPQHAQHFGDDLLGAIQDQIDDIEWRDLEKLDPLEVATHHASQKATVASTKGVEGQEPEYLMALAAVNDSIKAATLIYDNFPAKRELLGELLVADLIAARNREAASISASPKGNESKNEEKSSNSDSIVQQSGNLITERSEVTEGEKPAQTVDNVVPITGKTARQNAEFSPAAHLPGISGGEGQPPIVLPISHVDSPRASSDQKKHRFGAIAEKAKPLDGPGLGFDEQQASRDEMEVHRARLSDAPRP